MLTIAISNVLLGVQACVCKNVTAGVAAMVGFRSTAGIIDILTV